LSILPNAPFDKILFFLFRILILYPCEVCVPVPTAGRGSGEGDVQSAGLGWGTQRRDKAVVWSGCHVCLRGLSLYQTKTRGSNERAVSKGCKWRSLSQCCPPELLCSAVEFECHDKIKAKAGLY